MEPRTATITADASGKFNITGLANGTYTITPSTSNGYSYSPASQTFTINNGHALGLTFASQQTYTISGTISGAGGANASRIFERDFYRYGDRELFGCVHVHRTFQRFLYRYTQARAAMSSHLSARLSL